MDENRKRQDAAHQAALEIVDRLLEIANKFLLHPDAYQVIRDAQMVVQVKARDYYVRNEEETPMGVGA